MKQTASRKFTPTSRYNPNVLNLYPNDTNICSIRITIRRIRIIIYAERSAYQKKGGRDTDQLKMGFLVCP